MNTLFILIGVPGSGKTTLAKHMSLDHWYEADTYPNLYQKGVLQPALLSKAHTMCLSNMEMAMKQHVNTIVQSNTNLDLGEKGVLPYIRLAVTYHYKVHFVLPMYGLMHYPHYGNYENQVKTLIQTRSTNERVVPPHVIHRMVQQFYSILIQVQHLSSLSPPDMLSYITSL